METISYYLNKLFFGEVDESMDLMTELDWSNFWLFSKSERLSQRDVLAIVAIFYPEVDSIVSLRNAIRTKAAAKQMMNLIVDHQLQKQAEQIEFLLNRSKKIVNESY